MDQVRMLPRERGLFVLTALGARGLTLAPLLGRLVAAQATGSPWPLEQDLADAVDPARWLVRAARRAPVGSS
jgi:tRNA 5-methylaminomethyl-2-thiouridine biosynthesis bifunctional protein